VLAGYFVVLVGLSLARVVPVRLPAIQRLRASLRLSGRAYWHTTWASAQSAWS